MLLGDRLGGCIWYDLLANIGDGVAGMNVVDGGKAAGEECRSDSCQAVLARLTCCFAA